MLAALGAGVLAYMVQQQVFFPHPAVDAVFWLFAGILAAAVGVGGRPVRSILVVVVAGCVVVGSAANSWSAMLNDHDFERARTAMTYEAAYAHLTDAADRRSFDDEPYILMGALLQDADDFGLVARGEARIRRGAFQKPGNELVALALAEVRLQGFRVSGDPAVGPPGARRASTSWSMRSPPTAPPTSNEGWHSSTLRTSRQPQATGTKRRGCCPATRHRSTTSTC